MNELPHLSINLPIPETFNIDSVNYAMASWRKLLVLGTRQVAELKKYAKSTLPVSTPTQTASISDSDELRLVREKISKAAGEPALFDINVIEKDVQDHFEVVSNW